MMASAAVLVSCQEKEENLGVPEITLDPTTLEFGQQGGVDNAKTLTVTSTRDWTIEQDENEKWVTFSPASGSASSEPQTVTVTVTDNNESDRTATIRFTATNETVYQDLTVRQTGTTEVQYSTIESIRNLAKTGETVVVDNGAKIKATVVSSIDLNNQSAGQNVYVQDETAGIMLRFESFKEDQVPAFGDELEVDLSGQSLEFYNGTLQINNIPYANAVKLSSGNTVEAKEVSIEDFLANKYEGQYIAVGPVQVVSEDLDKTFAYEASSDRFTEIAVEDQNGNTFVVYSGRYSAQSLIDLAVPQGSGMLKGVAMIYNSKIQLSLSQLTDIEGMTGARFEDAPAQEMAIADVFSTDARNIITKGQVIAVSNISFIINDGGDENLYIYTRETPSVNVGDVVRVTGEKATYGQGSPALVQLSSPTVETISESITAREQTPSVLTSAQIDTYYSASSPMIQVTGMIVKNGSHTNIDFGGSVQGTPVSSSFDEQFVEGQNLVITGYFAGINGGGYFSILPTAVEQSSEPYFNISESSMSFSATGGDHAFSINSNVEWTVTSDAEWLTVNPANGNGTAEVTATATENTASGPREATITVSTTADVATKSYEIAVTQAAPASGDAKYYVKVTSAPSDWSGQYLIVYEGEEGNLAFDGSLTTLDAVNDYKEVTISGNGIESNDEVNAISFTIESSGSGYNIKSASGYYIYQTSDANGLKSSTSVPEDINTITYDSTDGSKIECNGAVLRFNSTSNQMRFRYYKSSSYTNQKPISLYKLAE